MTEDTKFLISLYGEKLANQIKTMGEVSFLRGFSEKEVTSAMIIALRANADILEKGTELITQSDGKKKVEDLLRQLVDFHTSDVER